MNTSESNDDRVAGKPSNNREVAFRQSTLDSTANALELDYTSTKQLHPKELQSLRDTRSTFAYTTLNLKERSIRLVQLKPDLSPGGFIQCSMRESSIEDAYTCLSYEWGTDSPTQSIVIGDSLFCIRKKLWDLLDVARQRHQSEWFWIDVMRINQSNVTERNHQLQQMGPTYEKARRVFSWLGKDGLIFLFCACEPNYETTAAFTGSRYWERAWITQEVAFARRVTVMAGFEDMPLGAAFKRYQKFCPLWYEPGGSADWRNFIAFSNRED